MKCPHCLKECHDEFADTWLIWRGVGGAEDAEGAWFARWSMCPACNRSKIELYSRKNQGVKLRLTYPRGSARPPLSATVPDGFKEDYLEACLVLEGSPKASAALSRRSLQHLLREKGGAKNKDLSEQIDEVLPSLPTDLAGMIDAIRVVGNFAAHPIKNTNTGEIVEVEPGEAEWLLGVLEELFDHVFVKPAGIAARRDALNAKLLAAKKPPMK